MRVFLGNFFRWVTWCIAAVGILVIINIVVEFSHLNWKMTTEYFLYLVALFISGICTRIIAYKILPKIEKDENGKTKTTYL